MIDVADKALLLLKKSSDPYSDIKRSSSYWIPLQWLYVEMVKNKDLVPISEISNDEKIRLWYSLREIDKSPDIKTMICQALYVYDQIKDL